jgi:hypothetical protein
MESRTDIFSQRFTSDQGEQVYGEQIYQAIKERLMRELAAALMPAGLSHASSGRGENAKQ